MQKPEESVRYYYYRNSGGKKKRERKKTGTNEQRTTLVLRVRSENWWWCGREMRTTSLLRFEIRMCTVGDCYRRPVICTPAT